ncbi:phosphotransferase enzyme family protein [Photobacterium sp. TY1-4]|uniref:phosphotransferase enzyme family protein n=1 Tax=Photobacterium sp. TY1-4 TaxID=2899122 RepID=UPI0021C035B4|nr:aminoglycoside phosphotransferase family protein [Photobacterium sp. TY1-4]UXI04257.1 aminoglycoside phosphotransferase family protein [Photobacterium sp. TY1-4]
MGKQIGSPERAIYHDEDRVIRPLNPWSATIHRLLEHLHVHGVMNCPRFISVDGEQEVLSYIEGETYNYPLSGAIASHHALTSAASLLRQLHDASVSFLSSNSDHQHQWMLPAQAPQEVICHGDFAPYNVALNGEVVSGVFDFDTAHPGPRVWDMAYAVYCWAPFKTDPTDALGTLSAQIERARAFCDAYGASAAQRQLLVEMMMKRLAALVAFMQSEADAGNAQFKTNIAQGHHLSYLADIDYLKQHRQVITSGLLVGI